MEEELVILLLILLPIVLFTAYRLGHRWSTKTQPQVSLPESGRIDDVETRMRRFDERIQVLERIVTDSGYKVSAQIEALRDTKRLDDEDSGMPLQIQRKERA